MATGGIVVYQVNVSPVFIDFGMGTF